MYRKGLVIDVGEEEVTVLPLISDACSSCSQECSKRGSSYCVSNPRRLDVKKGSIVGITAPAKVQAAQGIVSLLFPFICAVLGYFLSAPLSSFFSIDLTEGFKAICVLVFLFLSSLLVFTLARFLPLPGKLEIVQLY